MYGINAKGAKNIVNTLANSASASLSDKDQENFDAIYGSGAYNELQGYLSNIKSVGSENDFDSAVDDIKNAFPSFTIDQIMAMLQNANPKGFELWQ
jgi:hypothetical protein